MSLPVATPTGILGLIDEVSRSLGPIEQGDKDATAKPPQLVLHELPPRTPHRGPEPLTGDVP